MINRTDVVSVLFGAAVFVGVGFFGGGIYPSDKAIVLGLIFIAALLCRSPELTKKGWPLAWPLLLPVGAVVVSQFSSLIPGMGFEQVFLYSFLSLCVLALIKESDRKKVAIGIVAAAVFLSLTVCFEVAQHVLSIGVNGLGLSSAGGLMGANVTAVVLAAMVPSLMYLYEEKVIDMKVLAGLAAIVCLGIIFTGSRTGILALCAGLVIPAWRMPGKVRKGIFIAAGVCIVGIAIVYWPRFVAKLNPKYLTNLQRISMINAVFDGWRENPLVGFGPWTFSVVGQKYLSFPKWELHPHSFPLRILFETGLFGITAWITLVVISVRETVKNFSVDTSMAAGSLLALSVGSLTDDVIWVPVVTLLAFTWFAMLLEAKCVRLNFTVGRSLLIVFGLLAVLLPLLQQGTRGALPFAPPVFENDRAIMEARAPMFSGWEEDPIALRTAGYSRLRAGDFVEARSFLEKAIEKDPLMIFAPNKLDLAWVLDAYGRPRRAAFLVKEVRNVAPVLADWYEGVSSDTRWSFLDRHYKIEFANASEVSLESVYDIGDPLDWRSHRKQGAKFLLVGDTESAREAFEKSNYLAWQIYGTDPVLYRFLAKVKPEKREYYLSRAERRYGPVLPYRVYAPLIYRYSLQTTGDNSPWWKAKGAS